MNDMVTREEMERRVAQLKMEQANRKALDAFCLLHDARRLMEEAGANDEGMRVINDALYWASGFSPIEFMDDYPVEQRVSAYWDYHYADRRFDSLDELLAGVKVNVKSKYFRRVVLDWNESENCWETRWTFYRAPTYDAHQSIRALREGEAK